MAVLHGFQCAAFLQASAKSTQFGKLWPHKRHGHLPTQVLAPPQWVRPTCSGPRRHQFWQLAVNRGLNRLLCRDAERFLKLNNHPRLQHWSPKRNKKKIIKKKTYTSPKKKSHTHFQISIFLGPFKIQKVSYFYILKFRAKPCCFAERASGVPLSHSILQATRRLREAAVLSKCNSPSSSACHTGVNIQIKSHQRQTRLLQFNMGAYMTLGWGAVQRVAAAKPLT